MGQNQLLSVIIPDFLQKNMIYKFGLDLKRVCIMLKPKGVNKEMNIVNCGYPFKKH